MSLITTQQQTFERVEVGPVMKETLKAYILKQRRKKKEEEEQDAVLHRERKIREIKRQQDTASLEQTKDQIDQLEKKLEQLKKEKHDLFSHLKKVLNQEEDQRRRMHQVQLQHDREKSEVLAKVGVGPLPANLIMLDGMSPPQTLLAKPIALGGSPPGQATIMSPIKRPRSPSPHTSANAQALQTPSGFLSPKLSTPPYQRSPYQSIVGGGSLFSPRSVADAVSRFIPPLISPIANLQSPVVVASPQFPRLPAEVNPRSPLYDVRPVAPQATHLPARIPQHQHMSSIPIVPQQKQMGSITSGFPLNKSSLNSSIQVGLQQNRFSQQRNVPQQTFTPQPHQRL